MVVERDVFARLEETKLANLFGRDPAGGEVGDAAAGKGKTDVRDVDAFRQDRDAGGPDFVWLFARKAEDDVEIVNHEIEHNVDVETAGGEHAEAVNLEKEGNGQSILEGGDRRIEALEVADLENAAAILGQASESFACGGGLGDGLFDEHVDAGFEEAPGDLFMGDCGRCDDGGIDVADHLIHVGECRGAEFRG